MKKEKKLSVGLITVIITTVVLLLLDISLGIVFTINSIDKTTKIIQSKIMETAYTASTMLNGDEVGYLTYEDKEQQTDRYVTAFNILKSFKTSNEASNGDLAYIYLLVKQGDKIVFSIDPSDDPAIFLTEEPGVITDAMKQAFLGVAGVDDKPYQDRWGNLYSGYVPIRNSKDEVAAVVGVDVWADYLEREVASSVAVIVSIALVTIALGVSFSLVIGFSMRKKINKLSEDFSSLEDDIQSLVGDVETSIAAVDTEEKIIEEETDGVTDINNKLNKLRRDIRRYMEYAQEQASIDRLTKLGNRNAYARMVNYVNEQIKNNSLKELVVGIYDANGLKGVNDSTGHEYGDQLLKISANIVQKVYGVENTFRIGGDEFVIIYFGNIFDFQKKDEEVQHQIDEFNKKNTEMPFILSMALGMATYEVGQDHELLDVFRKADKDMYNNKNEYYRHMREKN